MDLTVVQSSVSDENSACKVPIRYKTLSDSDVKALHYHTRSYDEAGTHTIRDFIGPHQWFPVATDRNARLSPIVDRGLSKSVCPTIKVCLFYLQTLSYRQNLSVLPSKVVCPTFKVCPSYRQGLSVLPSQSVCSTFKGCLSSLQSLSVLSSGSGS